MTNLDKKMLTGFSREVRSYLPSIRDGIEGYRHDVTQRDGLEEALRYIHTIKGASGLMGLSALNRLTSCVQELLENVMGEELPIEEAQGSWLSRTMDQIEPYLDGLLEGEAADEEFLTEIEQSYSVLLGESDAEAVDTDEAELSSADGGDAEADDCEAVLADEADADSSGPLAGASPDSDVVSELDSWNVLDDDDALDDDAFIAGSAAFEAGSEDVAEQGDDSEPLWSQDVDGAVEEAAVESQNVADCDLVDEEAGTSSDHEDVQVQNGDALSSDGTLAVDSQSLSDLDDEQGGLMSEMSEAEWAGHADSEEMTSVSENNSAPEESELADGDATHVDAASFEELGDDSIQSDVEDSETVADVASPYNVNDLSDEMTGEEMVSESGDADTGLQDGPTALSLDAMDDDLAFGDAENVALPVEDSTDTPEFQEQDETLGHGVDTYSLPEGGWGDVDEPTVAAPTYDEPFGLTGHDLMEAAEALPAEAGALDELVESINDEVSSVYHHEELSDSRRSSLASLNVAERYVTFVIGETLYAVSVSNILEIGRIPQITPVPNVPMWIPGVINLRGEIISVIDLRTFLGVEDAYQDGDSRMLVVKTEGDEVTTSLVVDQVKGFVRLDTQKLAMATMPLDDWVAPYLTGVFEYENQVLAVVDLERFLLSPEICQFD